MCRIAVSKMKCIQMIALLNVFKEVAASDIG